MEAELNYQKQLGFYWVCDTVRAPASHFGNMPDEIFVFLEGNCEYSMLSHYVPSVCACRKGEGGVRAVYITCLKSHKRHVA